MFIPWEAVSIIKHTSNLSSFPFGEIYFKDVPDVIFNLPWNIIDKHLDSIPINRLEEDL